MCVIVDSCSMAKVFDPQNAQHKEFSPIRNWVLQGRGKLVFGGTKYKSELQAARRYMVLLAELARVRKAVSVPDSEVDDAEIRVNAIYSHRDFNDAHLAAIVRVSKCRLVCTCDFSAVPHLKRTELYRGVCAKPKFYLKSKNRDLLGRADLAGACCA